MTIALRASSLMTLASSSFVAARRVLPASFVAGALAIALVAPAQAAETAPKAEAAPKAETAPKKEAAKATPASEKEAKAAPAKEKEEAKAPPAPTPKALPPELSGECAWTGKRIVSLLARDDVDQAKRFLEFYRLFGCKEAHIAPTFRCVIAADAQPQQTPAPQAPAQNGAPAPAAPEVSFGDRVDQCWEQAE